MRRLDGFVNVCEILFHAAVVNNLADDGDVLVKRKNCGGRSVGRSVWQLVCSIKNKAPVTLLLLCLWLTFT